MENKKTDNSLIMCIISCLIPIGCFGIDKLLLVKDLQTETMSLVLAFVFTALTGLVYFIVSKISNPFYGMFAAIFGFKLASPDVSNLIMKSFEGQAVYSLVQMATLVLFLSLAIKHFRAQKNTDTPFEVLPIIALMFTILLFKEPSSALYTSLYFLGGQTLYGPYIAQALLYIWVVSIIYVTTLKSNAITVKLVSNFQILAMSINIVRRLGTILINLINGAHISMSYYCWIIIYLLVMLIFALLPKTFAKKSKAQ